METSLCTVRGVLYLLIILLFQYNIVNCKVRRQLLHKGMLNKVLAATSMLKRAM